MGERKPRVKTALQFVMNRSVQSSDRSSWSIDDRVRGVFLSLAVQAEPSAHQSITMNRRVQSKVERFRKMVVVISDGQAIPAARAGWNA
jgi:hypothetical protein